MYGLITQNNKVRATNPALRTQEKDVIGCQYFQIEPRVGFYQPSFTTDFPDSYLELLCADIDRLTALINN